MLVNNDNSNFGKPQNVLEDVKCDIFASSETA